MEAKKVMCFLRISIFQIEKITIGINRIRHIIAVCMYVPDLQVNLELSFVIPSVST